ncbi:MAG: histidinol-phosphate transaminase [Candidatus Nanopelagicales bacterium]|nr:histidinol-phosphate transaminase [Candidatus Nanopelagicales bacterium]
MSAFTPPLRDDLAGQVPYGAPQLDVPVRLNVNENPFPLPPELAAAMGQAVAAIAPELNRYPDREATELRAELAAYLGRESQVSVTGAQVWPANGSNEVMHQLFLAFGGPERTAVSFDPTYSMYPEYARDTFTRYLTFPRTADFRIDVRRAILAIDEQRPSIVLLTSPNNPTGTALPTEDLTPILDAALAHGAVLVVDEAYAEFRRSGTPSALELLDRYPNLVVTRTMSKAFGLAGARVGYAVADAALVDALRIVRLPYHLSAVTQAVAVTALRHSEVLQQQVRTLRDERDALADWLAARGFTVAPSDANFILFGRFHDRDAVWQSLLDHGVLIRQTGPQGWLRVSIGTPLENDRFRLALEQAPGTEQEAAP